MKTSVDFVSNLFAPFLPDEAQVNPGVYGAELAFWLARQLAQRGIVTSYPQYEDWGWFIEYTTADGDEHWLCCVNRDGATDEWRCVLRPRSRSLFGRNKAPVGGARPLLDALHALLAETPGIHDVTWE